MSLTSPIVTQFAPRAIFAGDSVEFSLSISNYPSDEWTVQWLLCTEPRVSVAGTAGVNNGFLVDADGRETEDVAPGTYATFLVFTNIADPEQRATVPQRGIVIRPNPVKPLQKTFAMLALEDVQAAISSLVKGTNQQVSIGSETYTKKDLNKLFEIRNQLRVEVAGERKRMGLPSHGGGRTIQTRFV
jgi:hypothetical protein